MYPFPILNGRQALASAPVTTWNSLDKEATVTLSNGDLTAATSNVSSSIIYRDVRGVAGKSSGKWYFEILIDAVRTPSSTLIGLASTSQSLANFPGLDAQGIGYYSADGNVYSNNASAGVGATYTAGDIVMIAWDAGTHSFWFGKNGTWNVSGSPSSGANAITVFNPGGSIYPIFGAPGDSVSRVTLITTPTYTIPSGFSLWG